MSNKKKIKLTDKENEFCQQYPLDNNATQAAIRAGYSEKTARSIGCTLLTKVNIQHRIDEVREELANKAEVTPEMLTLEYKKIAFSSIAHLHKTWITRKEFEDLTSDQKDCIQEIDTKVLKKNIGTSESPEVVDVEHVKVKLYDKLKALEKLGQMIGFFEKDNEQKVPKNLTEEDRDKLIDELIERANTKSK